jgi:hypothetical protein
VDCLKGVISARVFNRLARADGRGGADVAPCGAPVTVGDVVRLYRQGRLAGIGGLGRKSIREIEDGLIAHDLLAATDGSDMIAPDWPVDRLRAVLSGRVFNRLARADGRGGADLAPCGAPVTVGDVVWLYRQGRLGEIGGLGRKSIGEIEAGLVLAGLVLDPGGLP